MGLVSAFLGFSGVGIGFVIGIILGFYFFIYSDPKNEAFEVIFNRLELILCDCKFWLIPICMLVLNDWMCFDF